MEFPKAGNLLTYSALRFDCQSASLVFVPEKSSLGDIPRPSIHRTLLYDTHALRPRLFIIGRLEYIVVFLLAGIRTPSDIDA